MPRCCPAPPPSPSAVDCDSTASSLILPVWLVLRWERAGATAPAPYLCQHSLLSRAAALDLCPRQTAFNHALACHGHGSDSFKLCHLVSWPRPQGRTRACQPAWLTKCAPHRRACAATPAVMVRALGIAIGMCRRRHDHLSIGIWYALADSLKLRLASSRRSRGQVRAPAAGCRWKKPSHKKRVTIHGLRSGCRLVRGG